MYTVPGALYPVVSFALRGQVVGEDIIKKKEFQYCGVKHRVTPHLFSAHSETLRSRIRFKVKIKCMAKSLFVCLFFIITVSLLTNLLV